MKTGSRESSPSVRRSVRMACVSAPSETMTSRQTSSKISRRVTTAGPPLDQQDEQIEVARNQR